MGAIGGLPRFRAWRDARRYTGPKVTGTRLGRALPAAALGFSALAGMLTMASHGALAVNFTTSDQKFQVYSNYVQGISAGGYLARNSGYSAASQVGVAELGIRQAYLSGLCMIVNEPITVAGVPLGMSIVITAGVPVRGSFDPNAVPTTDGAGNPITYDATGKLTGSSLSNAIQLTDLFLNTNQLQGFGNKLSGLTMGQDAATTASTAQLNSGTGTWLPGQNLPTAGNFGLTASTLNIAGLNGSSYGITLHNPLTALNKLRVTAHFGTSDQSICPTQAQ